MSDSVLPSLPLSTELLSATFSLEGQIQFRNEFWLAIFGEGEDPWAHLLPEDREDVSACLAEAALGSLVTNRVLFVNNPNRDNPLPVLMHFLPVQNPEPDSPNPLLAITLTGEVLTEPESTITNQTQRSRFENLGRMTLGSIHNINNLLASVLGNLEIIRELELLAVEQEELSGYLQNIKQAASDGAGITRRIQDYMRNEVREEGKPVNLSRLLEVCKDLTEPYWNYEPRRQGIFIQTEGNFEDVPFIHGNEGELREVFINLIQNAIHAMPDGGQLTLSTYLDDADQVCGCVADTGTGIPEGVINRIFDPMFSTKGEKGNGMGLAVSEGIVKRHRGSIQVESSSEEGTRFIVQFPAIEAQKQEPVPKKQEISTHPVRVLAVDDEEGVRNVISRLLSLKGHTVTVASSGTEALSLFESNLFDLVITDLGMPGMNGRQLAASIRSLNEEIPIVLLSGDTELGSSSSTINAILGKPFSITDLQQTIYSLVPSPVDH